MSQSYDLPLHRLHHLSMGVSRAGKTGWLSSAADAG